MSNKYIIITLLFFVPISCLSQLTATWEVIDSIRVKYCIDKNYLKRTILYDSIPPPPLTKKDEKKFYADFSCKKRYKIPKKELSTLYPFNADSIVISILDDCYWQNGKEEIIGKMTIKQINQFVDILYNYGFKKIEGVHMSWIDICGCGLPIPDVRLYFYHETESKYLDIFAKGFVDSFAEENPYKDYDSEEVIYESNNGIYWGDRCEETYSKLYSFIKKNFKYKLISSRYKESRSCSTFDIKELKEHNYK